MQITESIKALIKRIKEKTDLEEDNQIISSSLEFFCEILLPVLQKVKSLTFQHPEAVEEYSILVTFDAGPQQEMSQEGTEVSLTEKDKILLDKLALNYPGIDKVAIIENILRMYTEIILRLSDGWILRTKDTENTIGDIEYKKMLPRIRNLDAFPRFEIKSDNWTTALLGGDERS